MNAIYQTEAIEAIQRGGPVMLALAAVSLLLYRNVFMTLVTVYRIRLSDWSGLNTEAIPAADPLERERTDRVLRTYRRWLKERQKTARLLIAAAPLLGLLGTVMGMLNTFQSLSSRAGQQTANQVADGVSMALITTQTGLTIAIPAVFMLYWIQRISTRLEAEYFGHGKEASTP